MDPLEGHCHVTAILKDLLIFLKKIKLENAMELFVDQVREMKVYFRMFSHLVSIK